MNDLDGKLKKLFIITNIPGALVYVPNRSHD